jgi:hypothetical protein
MDETLVDQAKEQKKKSRYTEQDVALAIAFLNDEIPMQNLLNVKGLPQYVSGQVFVSGALKFGIRNKFIKLEKISA